MGYSGLEKPEAVSSGNVSWSPAFPGPFFPDLAFFSGLDSPRFWKSTYTCMSVGLVSMIDINVKLILLVYIHHFVRGFETTLFH